MNKIDYKLLLTEDQASKGNMLAQYNLSHYYWCDRKLTKEKAETLIGYLKQIAEDKETEKHQKRFALERIGMMYYLGQGVKKDYKTAMQWFEKAAKYDATWALCNLGYCYYWGYDVDIDYAKAHDYFARAIIVGNVNATYKLGDMYYYGQHVEENKDIAFYWYQQADKSDYDEYDEQQGENENYFKYLNPNVAYRLGKCYLHGHGTTKNVAKALLYLNSSKTNLEQQIKNNDPFAGIVLPYVEEQLKIAKNTPN